MMNEENKELEGQEAEAPAEEVQAEAPVEEAPVRKVEEEEAPAAAIQEEIPAVEVEEEAPAAEARDEAPAEEAPKPVMDAITEEARDLKEKVVSYSQEAKESLSADYKTGGAGALVKNKYFWIVLGIVVVVLILLGVFD